MIRHEIGLDILVFPVGPDLYIRRMIPDDIWDG